MVAADLATTSSDGPSAPAKRSRAEPEAADNATAKKPRQSVDGRRERAVWGLAEEKLLLFLYLRAKNDSELRSDKGIKSRGWQNVVDDLNKHSGKEFDKGERVDWIIDSGVTNDQVWLKRSTVPFLCIAR